MAGRLDGKVAVITGGASGMGQASVLRFLDEGARVVFCDLNDNKAEESMSLAAARGHVSSIAYRHANVAEEDDIRGLVALALQRFGRLDCMFNNAGIGGAFGPIGETRVEEWDFTFAVLVRGVFLGIKHASNAMRHQGQGGSLISTASIAGLAGGAGPHAYSAAKAAVINLTRAVSSELAADRIRVNAIAPGAVETPLAHGGHPERFRARALGHQPWPQMGQPEDIANAALFLASNDSAFITGETIVVDGGLLALGPNLWGYDRASSPMLKKAGLNTGSTGGGGSVRNLPPGAA
ncbi:MAG: glucose 1-dehydrogenase [Alphaproteobacteria bacterium]|nr:glucose 1-dehydrogenase [Alphaproteobacteria bacterium]